MSAPYPRQKSLVRLIKQHKNMAGIEVGSKKYKASYFLDDIFLSYTLPNLIRVLGNLVGVSGSLV